MKKIFSILALLFAVSVTAQPVFIQDFNDSNTVFTTGYTKSCSGANALYNEGTWCITYLPSSKHPSWCNYQNGGKMMVINGNTMSANPYDTVWRQRIPNLVKGKTYRFELSAKSVHPSAPAKLSLFAQNRPVRMNASIGNTIVATNVMSHTLSADTSSSTPMTLIFGTFIADTTFVNLGILDSTQVAAGNDFAIDNILIREVVALPITIQSFDVVKSGENAFITWTVAGTKLCQLQSSTDLKEWETISTQKDATLIYRLKNGTNYFRLMLYDGSTQYSEIIKINNSILNREQIIDITTLDGRSLKTNNLSTLPRGNSYILRYESGGQHIFYQ